MSPFGPHECLPLAATEYVDEKPRSPTSPAPSTTYHLNHDPHSPSARHTQTYSIKLARVQPAVDAFASRVERVAQVSGEYLRFARAGYPRASRAARASTPSPYSQEQCYSIIEDAKLHLTRRGLEPVKPDHPLSSADVTAAPNGRSAARHLTWIPAASGDGASSNGESTNHRMQQNTSRDVEAYNQEATWLLGGLNAVQMYDRLAESALRSNAVNSCLTHRRETQGASLQTTRINCRGIGNAAAAQCAVVALAIALAEADLRSDGFRTVNPAATNAVDLCVFADDESLSAVNDDYDYDDHGDDGGGVGHGVDESVSYFDQLVPVVSTGWLLYNANPVKIGRGSIVTAAKYLASREEQDETISCAVTAPLHMIKHLCDAICDDEYVTDPIWASIVLIVFLCNDPRSRKLLEVHTDLTDVDVQIAFAMEAYGRSEITRRARLHVAQKRTCFETRNTPTSTHAVHPMPLACSPSSLLDTTDPATGLSIEDDDASILHDDSADDESGFVEPGITESIFDENEDEDERVLGTRRKRSSRHISPVTASDAYSILCWWHRALRSKHAKLLSTLVAASTKRAKNASNEKVEEQYQQGNCGGVEDEAEVNETVRKKACQNAEKSNRALRKLVHRDMQDAPQWAIVEPVVGDSMSNPTVGVVRMPPPPLKAANLSSRDWHRADECAPMGLHACVLAPRKLQPSSRAKMTILWSDATQPLKTCMEGDDALLPNVLESYEALARLECRGRAKGRQQLDERCFHNRISHGAHAAALSTESGTTRSFIALKAHMATRWDTVEAAKVFSDEVRCGAAARKVSGETSRKSSARQTTSISLCKWNGIGRKEPLCTPASRLAIGLRVNELLRRFMRGRTRKNDPCRVFIGPLFQTHEPAPSSKDLPFIMDSEPLPLLTITDFDIRCQTRKITNTAHLGPNSTPSPSSLLKNERREAVSLALHVCADGAVRAVDAIRSLHTDTERRDGSIGSDSQFKQRALLYAGSSQASFIGDLASSASASATNAAINSSKKIGTPDLTTLCLLSIWDVYCGGLANVKASYDDTAYCGTYGPTLDTGLTSMGLAGHYVCSDQRGHGTMSLSTEVADEIAKRLAMGRYVNVRGRWERGGGMRVCDKEGEVKAYASPPLATRGVPHGYIPGIHTVLDDLQAALRSLAIVNERCDTVRGLFVMPFSAWTQCLRPDVECTADSTTRHCFRDIHELSSVTGRSYMPDATSEGEALVRENLWRRPCQASISDNPFATSYEYADSLFNALNALAVIARQCGGVDQLHALVGEWHGASEAENQEYDEDSNEDSGDDDDDDDDENGERQGGNLSRRFRSYQWAADSCVLLFGAIYPQTHAVAQPVVPKCYARACVVHARRAHDRGRYRKYGLRLDQLIGDNDDEDGLVAQARALWGRFDRKASASPSTCPWHECIKPMLEAILDKEGSHDTSQEDIDHFRKCFDAVASRGAWLAYSEDGNTPPKHPNPAWRCLSADSVRCPTLDPVFAAHGDALQYEARGCLVGLKPFQLRQIYALLLGAHLPGVTEVQVVRNEGTLAHQSTLPSVPPVPVTATAIATCSSRRWAAPSRECNAYNSPARWKAEVV